MLNEPITWGNLIFGFSAGVVVAVIVIVGYGIGYMRGWWS